MRQQRTVIGMQGQITRNAAEHPFTKATMPIGACDDDIGLTVLQTGIELMASSPGVLG
jgi:hypothetical protein